MQPQNQRTNNTPRTLNRRLIYVVLFLVLAVLLGYLGYTSRQKNASPATTSQMIKGDHPYSYAGLDNYTLPGVKAGTGISFFKPAEYKLALESKDQASFSHTLKVPAYAPLGALHVASISPSAASKEYLKDLATSFANSNSAVYKSAVEPIKQFVSSRFSPLYDISYSSATKFTSSSIKDNAWVFDLSAAPKPQKQPASSNPAPADSSIANAPPEVQAQIAEGDKAIVKQKVPQTNIFENYKGQVIFAVGKSTFYYFVVYSTDYNWNNSQSTWQKVIDSLKVDQ